MTLTLTGAAAVVVLLGIATNHSSALMVIGAPVLGAAALQLIPAGRVRLARLAAMASILFLAGAAALAAMLWSGMSASNETSVTIRSEIWQHSGEAISDHWLGGSGIGTFPALYPQYEDPATVDRTYINHAHNDYLEILLEAGLPGAALLILFLVWWGNRALSIWRSQHSAELARAACIASAAILLHSLVDYPLRTAAIATSMAMALALMADPATRRRARLAELRPTRHLTL